MEISASNKPLGPGPKTRVCYICGRQYGLNSYEIHLKQCKELFLAREAQKDPKERKPLPEDPMIKLLNKTGVSETSKSTSLNNTSTSSAGSTQGISLDEINKLASESFNTETLCACVYCGRTFLPEKLTIHNKSCTADNPARKVTDNVRRGNPAPKISDARPSTSSASSNPRPSTTQSIKSRIQAQAQENSGSESSPLDSLSNTLAGSLGSTAGREVRKAPRLTSSPSKSVSSDSTKEEIIEQLLNRIEYLEVTANEMLQSASEMRGLIAKLS